jgi:hypothetical protein
VPVPHRHRLANMRSRIESGQVLPPRVLVAHCQLYVRGQVLE